MRHPFALLLALTACTGAPADDEPAGNRPPDAPGVRVEPASPGTGDDLVAVLDAPSDDADGDAVTYTYGWSRDGTMQPHLTTDTVPASDCAARSG